MPKTKTLTEQRDELQAAIPVAAERVSEARYRGRHKRDEATASVIAPLVDFQDAIDLKRADATPPEQRADRLASLTADFLAAIADRGFVLTAERSTKGWALVPKDPAIDAELVEAEQALTGATAALRTFERDNGDALVVEEKTAAGAALREAIDGGDFDTARKLLDGVDPGAEDPAMTTDHPPEEERRWLPGDGNDVNNPNRTYGGVPVRKHAVAV